MRISDWSSDVCSSDLLSLCEDGRRDATEQRGGEERGDRPACAGHHERNHWLSSFDQLKASTKMPSGFLRRPSAVPGCWITTVRIADQCVVRSEEHTSELQSLMRISYAVFCLKKKKKTTNYIKDHQATEEHAHNTATPPMN